MNCIRSQGSAFIKNSAGQFYGDQWDISRKAEQRNPDTFILRINVLSQLNQPMTNKNFPMVLF